jgi:protein TonB
MVESAGQYRSSNLKWTTAAAFVVEGALLAVGVVAALVHTGAIVNTVKLVRVEVPLTPTPIRTEIVSTGGGGGGASAVRQPNSIPTTIATGGSVPRVGGREDYAGDLNLPPGLPLGAIGQNPGIFTSAPQPRIEHRRIQVSSMDPAKLIHQVRPAYPQLARAARISGEVRLRAIIARDGSIQNLAVVSGPAMLNQAALDAVHQWRYKPTILGGEPVEIETTITVNFILGQ